MLQLIASRSRCGSLNHWTELTIANSNKKSITTTTTSKAEHAESLAMWKKPSSNLSITGVQCLDCVCLTVQCVDPPYSICGQTTLWGATGGPPLPGRQVLELPPATQPQESEEELPKQFLHPTLHPYVELKHSSGHTLYIQTTKVQRTSESLWLNTD